MEFLELAQKRYSVRSFSQRRWNRKSWEKVLEAGRLAPTATNAQPQRILVLQGQEEMSRLGQCTKFTFGAPMALVVCADKEAAWVRGLRWQKPRRDRCLHRGDAYDAGSSRAGVRNNLGRGFSARAHYGIFWRARRHGGYGGAAHGVSGRGRQAKPRHADRKPLGETVFYHSFQK